MDSGCLFFCSFLDKVYVCVVVVVGGENRRRDLIDNISDVFYGRNLSFARCNGGEVTIPNWIKLTLTKNGIIQYLPARFD